MIGSFFFSLALTLSHSFALLLLHSFDFSLFFLSLSRFSSFSLALCTVYTALLIHRFFFLPFGFDLIFLCIGNLFSNPTNNRTRVISSVAFLIFTGVCTIVNHVFVFAMGSIKKRSKRRLECASFVTAHFQIISSQKQIN